MLIDEQDKSVLKFIDSFVALDVDDTGNLNCKPISLVVRLFVGMKKDFVLAITKQFRML